MFWASVVIDEIRDDEGALIGFAKGTRNITVRRQASHILLASENRYLRLIEAVVDYAIFQLDVSGNVTTRTPGAQRLNPKAYHAKPPHNLSVYESAVDTTYITSDQARLKPYLADHN
jgi:hypothetical protein